MNQAKLNKALDYLQSKHCAQWASAYGEPGYSDPVKGIILANWNYIPKGLGDWLEKRGFELEWSDEWTVCGNGKAWRTSPDSHWWEPSCMVTNDGELITRDDDASTWIDEQAMTDVGQPCACLPSWVTAEDLGWQGFMLYSPDGEPLESGWHPGQTDSPEDWADRAFDAGALRVVFRKLENSQFYMRFECWAEFYTEEGAAS